MGTDLGISDFCGGDRGRPPNRTSEMRHRAPKSEKPRSVPIHLFLLLLCGCSGGGVGTLPLSWQFADGRTCAGAGVANVAVLEGNAVLGNFGCELGIAPAAVMLENTPRSSTLSARALSFQSAELYRGELAVGPALLPTTVMLHPTQSR
jgi:hypothetical protein